MDSVKRSEQARKITLASWRDYPLMNTSAGTMLHNLTGSWRFIKPVYEDKTPPCQNACPAGNDIEGWIRLLQRGENEKAYWHLKREQPFPAILGRVCFRFCEAECNRNPLDSAVGIKELERFLGDRVPLSTPRPDMPEAKGPRLGIVGSGPAGMSAAYFGRLLGFRVTIFEDMPLPGGILRFGIPAYRLPREIVEEEFKGLQNMGIELRTGVRVGKDVSLRELREVHDYLFLASGVHEGMRLDIPGEKEGPAVISGLRFLKRVARGEDVPVGPRVAVIGGGNTAIDAARTAVRLNCDVTLIYRRSESEMPAHPEEVLEAKEEGVRFRFLAAPERIDFNGDGSIGRLLCCEMELGPPDESGRRRPLKKPDALFDIQADTVLSAIGETADLDYLQGLASPEEGVVRVGEGLRVEADDRGKGKVFAGGDIIGGPHTVVHAVASGKRAVIAMDCDYKGTDLQAVLETIAVGEGTALSFSEYIGCPPLNPGRRNMRKVVYPDRIVYDYFQKTPPVEREIRDAPTRKRSFAPYTSTYKGDEAEQEAERCFHCGRCTECDNCLILCPDMSVLPRGPGRFGYTYDYDYCKGCGICFAECPRCAITMVEEETPSETGHQG